MQIMYEARVASLQRLVAFYVMFHEMGKRVQVVCSWDRNFLASYGLIPARLNSLIKLQLSSALNCHSRVGLLATCDIRHLQV